MRIILILIAIVIVIFGLIIAIGVFLCPLYYVWTRNEPLYLLLFLISPFIAGIIAQVFLDIAEAFEEAGRY